MPPPPPPPQFDNARKYNAPNSEIYVDSEVRRRSTLSNPPTCHLFSPPHTVQVLEREKKGTVLDRESLPFLEMLLCVGAGALGARGAQGLGGPRDT